MTTQKDFKRLVRGRMRKTGESYTTARASLITQAAKRPSTGNGAHPEANGTSISVLAPAPAAQKAPPADFAKLAGMADSVIKEKTGCAWDRWVWALDQAGAYNWPHRAIAQGLLGRRATEGNQPRNHARSGEGKVACRLRCTPSGRRGGR